MGEDSTKEHRSREMIPKWERIVPDQNHGAYTQTFPIKLKCFALRIGGMIIPRGGRIEPTGEDSTRAYPLEGDNTKMIGCHDDAELMMT